MRRDASLELEKWLSSNRRKPLILRGARQVGKSTLVRNFCKDQQIDLVEINFEETLIAEIEKEKNWSIDKVIQEIEAITEKKVTANSLIFLDEIQESPLAINKLRYFYEKRPDLKIIAAGSLLEFVLEDHSFSMPVGRIQYLYLGPMTFSEFLYARGQQIILEQIENSFPNYPSKTTHEKIIELFKEYLFIGGMPEAIKVFIETKSFLDVTEVHREIIKTYIDDFPKYRKKRRLPHMEELFEYVPLNLGQKIIYTNIVTDKSKAVKEAMLALLKAKVITKVTANNCSGLPLKIGKKDNFFKLYFLDVGLSGFVQGLKWTDINRNNNDKLLTKGMLAEQFIAQHLLFADGFKDELSIFYWARDSKNSQAEIDFVLNINSSIVPIEIKSGTTGTLKSMIKYNEIKSPKLSIRMDLKYRDSDNEISSAQKKINKLINLPIYYVEKLGQLNP